MTCDTCKAPMKERRTTAETPYFYRIGGLPRVGLSGITLYECPRCKGDSPVIPKIGELHKVITRWLVEKSAPLTGDELRFLRKNAGFAAQKFAALIGIDPAHLSRIENGKREGLGPATDRLARAIVTAAVSGGEAARQVLLEFADAAEDRHKGRQFELFTLERNRWKVAKAA